VVRSYCFRMPTFDVVSEVDMQEVRNAVDQANREAATRFDFKGTDSSIELTEKELVLSSSTDDRLRALFQVLQEKLVKREVSLKSFDVGKIEEASRGSARQRLTIQAGISSDHAKRINKFIKDLGLKGVSSQTQGDQLRVSGKKRDDLQTVISACKAEDFGIPLQFSNFRD
jgi:cyclic-di-GMP-binding protein